MFSGEAVPVEEPAGREQVEAKDMLEGWIDRDDVKLNESMRKRNPFFEMMMCDKMRMLSCA